MAKEASGFCQRGFKLCFKSQGCCLVLGMGSSDFSAFDKTNASISAVR